MHIQSTISDGRHSIDEIAGMAKEKGIGVVFITDHDMKRWEYGFPPFRRLFKKTVELDSVLKFGSERYLTVIKEAQKNNKGIILIPGVEAAPFYYWAGSLLKRNMALMAWHRHMLVVGLDKAEDYENLPLVGNRKSMFDQYHGDMWFKPYQDLIDYVEKKGGMTFWVHPEAENSQSTNGIFIHTLPYADFLLKTLNFTGFGILHEGYKEVGSPGGMWDEMLKEYAAGKRKKGVVAIGEIDYEGKGGDSIDDVKNVFFVKEKTKSAILEALKEGCFYVVRKSSGCDLRLTGFEISSGTSKAVMGESMPVQDKCIVKAHIMEASGKTGQRVLVKLIKNGGILNIHEGDLPLLYEFTDDFIPDKFGGYYRMDISCEGSRLLSNTVFFSK